MSEIKPFKALRPAPALARKIAAPPYDVYDTVEARNAVIGNPYSFLHVDKAEIDLDEAIDPYDPRVYEGASASLSRMLENGWLIRETRERFYIYRLEMAGRRQTGLVALTSVDEYINGSIKKHELTREEKELDRTRHIKSCNAHTGPIFMAYRAVPAIKSVISSWTDSNAPVYDFVSDDGVRHTVWVIADENAAAELVGGFSSVSRLYIADGHHRNAAAVRVALERRENSGGHTGKEPYNHYLSVLFPDDELLIMAYNRVVKDLNGLSEDAFIAALSKSFILSMRESPVEPANRHEFGLYLSGRWYKLIARPELIDERSVLGGLDVSILQGLVIGPVLGINDIRNDKRIDFVGGIRGVEEICRIVDSGEMKAGFTMFPTSISELIETADADGIMPPKSTWFEPKLRSGLFIHELG